MTPRPGLFRQTPPAIFPSIFGLLGLGLAWRAGADATGLPVAIAELILGAATLLYLFALSAYLAKAVRRPGVVLQDLRILPGRSGLSATTLSVLLLAAVLAPARPDLATGLMFAGLAAHAGLAILAATALLTGPHEQRQVTPVWHLSFVGFIITPLSALPLGYVALAQVITVATGLAAGAIYAVSLVQLARGEPAAPLRPLLAIHLAPVSLLGTVALEFGHAVPAAIFGAIGAAILLVLLVFGRWITVAGFNPFWGAFTFPLAAYAGLTLLLRDGPGGWAFSVIGVLCLAAASGAIPLIAARVLRYWAKGRLAAITNAAVA